MVQLKSVYVWCEVGATISNILLSPLSSTLETSVRCPVTLGYLHMLKHEERKICLEILSVRAGNVKYKHRKFCPVVFPPRLLLCARQSP